MRLKKWKEYLLKKVRKRAITHIASCPVLSYFKVLKWILQKVLEDTCFLNDTFFLIFQVMQGKFENIEQCKDKKYNS